MTQVVLVSFSQLFHYESSNTGQLFVHVSIIHPCMCCHPNPGNIANPNVGPNKLANQAPCIE